MITLFDGLLIGLMLVSGVLAMVRGFSREALSIASWVAAAGAAFYLYKQVSPLVQPYTERISPSEQLADIAAAGIIFVIVLIIVSLITMKIADFIVDSKIGALDRTLGFVFGAVRGALLVVVGLMFLNWLMPENQPSWVAEAKSKTMLESIGDGIVQMLPDDPERSLFDRIRPNDGAEGEGGQDT